MLRGETQDLPVAGWRKQPLKDLASFKKGSVVPAQKYMNDGFVPYIGADNFDGVYTQFTRTNATTTCKPDDVLMLWDGERSGLCASGLEGVIGSTVTRLRPLTGVDGRFLYYQLLHNFGWIQAHRTGTGVPHVPKDIATRLQLLLPAEQVEQRRIAVILDAVAEAIQTTKAGIDKLRMLQQGVLRDLLTRGMVVGGKLRPTASTAPEFYHEVDGECLPLGWSLRPLSSLCATSSGGTPDRQVRRYWGGSVPWIKTAEIDYRLITEAAETITERGLNESSAKLIPEGTILMAMYGEGVTRGKVAILGIDAAINQACLAIFPGSNLNRDFLYWTLVHCYRRLRDLSNEGSQKNLSSTLVGSFQIAHPSSLKEQAAIAEILNDLRERLDTEVAALKKLQLLKTGLMGELLDASVRVTTN
jgi:type I restriction enzyme S subunit